MAEKKEERKNIYNEAIEESVREIRKVPFRDRKATKRPRSKKHLKWQTEEDLNRKLKKAKGMIAIPDHMKPEPKPLPMPIAPVARVEDPDDDLPSYPPGLEPWDQILLGSGVRAYPEGDLDLPSLNKISPKIEHPPFVQGPVQVPDVQPLQIQLTKRERKQLRKQNRVQIEKDKQKAIKLGILPPPQPRIKISNMMKVLGSTAAGDPTMIEKMTLDEMATRVASHNKRNQDRKLDPQARRAKTAEKLNRESDTSPLVTVFRVGSLENPSNRFKVTKNAEQLKLKGRALVVNDKGDEARSMLIVEGGPKPTKRFQHLMLNRIKWDKDDIFPGNWCKLVFQGPLAKANFHNFQQLDFDSQPLAQKYCYDWELESFWNLDPDVAMVEDKTLLFPPTAGDGEDSEEEGEGGAGLEKAKCLE